jgi:ubiquinone/menaquinone biosynthesis C-methylase UbiE
MKQKVDLDESIKKHYETTEFKKWGYDVVNLKMAEMESVFAFKHFKKKQGLILDAGCGGGRLTAGLFDNKYEKIQGMDFCFRFCKIYKSTFSQSPSMQGDITAMPLKNEMYDYVMCMSNVLSFLSTSKQHQIAINEMHRLLKKDGTLVLSVLNYHGRWFNKLLYMFLKTIRTFQSSPPVGRNFPWMKKGVKPNYSFYKNSEPQSYWFTKNEVDKYLKNSGFVIIDFANTIGPITGAAMFFAAQKK